MIREDAITTVLVRMRADLPIVMVNLSSGERSPAGRQEDAVLRNQEHEVLWVTEWAAVTAYEACFALIYLHRGDVFGSLWNTGDWFLDPDDRARLQALGAAQDEAEGHDLAQANRIIYLYDFRDRAARVLEQMRDQPWKGLQWVTRHNDEVSAAQWTDKLDTWKRRIARVTMLAKAAESERKALLALRRGER